MANTDQPPPLCQVPIVFDTKPLLGIPNVDARAVEKPPYNTLMAGDLVGALRLAPRTVGGETVTKPVLGCEGCKSSVPIAGGEPRVYGIVEKAHQMNDEFLSLRGVAINGLDTTGSPMTTIIAAGLARTQNLAAVDKPLPLGQSLYMAFQRPGGAEDARRRRLLTPLPVGDADYAFPVHEDIDIDVSGTRVAHGMREVAHALVRTTATETLGILQLSGECMAQADDLRLYAGAVRASDATGTDAHLTRAIASVCADDLFSDRRVVRGSDSFGEGESGQPSMFLTDKLPTELTRIFVSKLRDPYQGNPAIDDRTLAEAHLRFMSGAISRSIVTWEGDKPKYVDLRSLAKDNDREYWALMNMELGADALEALGCAVAVEGLGLYANILKSASDVIFDRPYADERARRSARLYANAVENATTTVAARWAYIGAYRSRSFVGVPVEHIEPGKSGVLHIRPPL